MHEPGEDLHPLRGVLALEEALLEATREELVHDVVRDARGPCRSTGFASVNVNDLYTCK